MIDIQENFQIEYPTSDGKRMAENTRQFEELVKIKLNLEKTTVGKNIFVAGDLLWYPVKGQLISAAPDVMVIIGRPKGHRDSYKQWEEEDIPPQIAFEIWSPTNTASEKRAKLAFYEQYGVKEYYTYDTHRNKIAFYMRDKGKLKLIPNVTTWKSPLLGITLDWNLVDGLELYHPDGERFLSYMELVELHSESVERFEQTMRLAEKKLKQVERTLQETQSNLQETQTNLQEKEKELAEEKKRTDQLAEQNRQLIAKLKALGLYPDNI